MSITHPHLFWLFAMAARVAPGGQDVRNRWQPMRYCKRYYHYEAWWSLDGRGAMHLNAEKAATAVMTVAIAGVGPACVALLLLL
jgi:hypothetical protein